MLATVNPNRLDDTSGLRGLCAAGVAFLAAVATLRTLRRAGWFATRPEPDLRGLLDLVALATVCDVMPLTGVNRALVAQGLKVMGQAGAARHCRPAGGGLTPRTSLPRPRRWDGRWGRGSMPPGGSTRLILGLRLLLTEDVVEARALAIAAGRRSTGSARSWRRR